MSSRPHLLILLLYLSVQPCNGRHLLSMDSSNLPHHPRKVDHVELSKYSLERDQSFNLVPVNKGVIHEIRGDVAAERLKGPKTPSTDVNSRREMEPGVTQIQSHDDMDPLLHVPHEKHEEHLEFNIDYGQPKAHPPSHN
ncbi:hypothetical protein COCNU_scaffold017943G000040 [Cocos nucifera]|nr:hypothetical protein [Cocos nucifera]